MATAKMTKHIANMTKYKLYYLNFEGRGEPIRLLFHYAGVPFEDCRIGVQDWKDTWKAKMPFGRVPVLEIDGVMLPESHAIGRYLAKNFGLVGADDLEAAQIDALLSHFEEFFKESIEPMLAMMAGFKEGDKDKFYNEKFLPDTAKELPKFEKYIQDAGNGLHFKSGLTWADFQLCHFWAFSGYVFPGFFERHPILKQAADKFYELPKIKEYYEKHAHKYMLS
uniref:Glutathione S-transferase n=1 Tax=Acrobeloides nanus TaxID=290746 RepID=A0A914DCF6_9BILA